MSKRKEYFSIRSDMYHYAASSDYDGGYIRSPNSYISNGDVYSYATKVAMFDKNKQMLLYTGHRYSNTTSNSLYELRRAFDHYKLLMVYDFSLRDGWDRLKESVRVHSKHPATRKEEKNYFINTVDSFKNLVRWYGKNDKRMQSKIMEKADTIVLKYQQEMDAKRKRREEIWAVRREKEEQARQKRISLTESIIKEYMPDCDIEPKTFRETLVREDVKVPVSWMKEHHPELFDKDGCYLTNEACFSRRYNYMIHDFDDNFTYSRDRENYKLLRGISRWGGSYASYPDILVYDKDKKLLYTSQHCEVDDTEGHVKNLLGLFLKAIDEGRDYSFVIGRHCGPYEIREYNASEKFLRVGCHCFLLENLREVYEDMKGV